MLHFTIATIKCVLRLCTMLMTFTFFILPTMLTIYLKTTRKKILILPYPYLIEHIHTICIKHIEKKSYNAIKKERKNQKKLFYNFAFKTLNVYIQNELTIHYCYFYHITIITILFYFSQIMYIIGTIIFSSRNSHFGNYTTIIYTSQDG